MMRAPSRFPSPFRRRAPARPMGPCALLGGILAASFVGGALLVGLVRGGRQ